MLGYQVLHEPEKVVVFYVSSLLQNHGVNRLNYHHIYVLGNARSCACDTVADFSALFLPYCI